MMLFVPKTFARFETVLVVARTRCTDLIPFAIDYIGPVEFEYDSLKIIGPRTGGPWGQQRTH